MSWLRGACTSCERAPASERGACTSWLRGACTYCERAPASERGAWTSWLRGACTSCDRAPARKRGACTSWLLAVCVSIAFADATSGGQEVCAIPTVAEREKTVTTLIVAASNFLIVVSVLSDCVLTAFSTGVLLLAPGAPTRSHGMHPRCQGIFRLT